MSISEGGRGVVHWFLVVTHAELRFLKWSVPGWILLTVYKAEVSAEADFNLSQNLIISILLKTKQNKKIEKQVSAVSQHTQV